MHKHSHKPSLFTGHALLPTVEAVPISTQQQWSTTKGDWGTLLILSAAEWSTDQHSLLQQIDGLIVEQCDRMGEKVWIFVYFNVCVNERTLGGDSRYLRPTDRHLALHQPSTTRPYGILRNVGSWHQHYAAYVYGASRTAHTYDAEITSNIYILLCGQFTFSLSLSILTNINTKQ